jgi:hypothetical protein
MSHKYQNPEFLDDPDDKVNDLLRDPEVLPSQDKYAPKDNLFKVHLPGREQEETPTEEALPDLTQTVMVPVPEENVEPEEEAAEEVAPEAVEEATEEPEDAPEQEEASEEAQNLAEEIESLPEPTGIVEGTKTLQVVPDDSGDDGNDQESSDKASRLFWMLVFGMLCVLILGLAYLCYEQYRMLPPDPLEVVEQKYKKTVEIYNQRLLDSFEVEKAKIRGEAFVQKREAVQIREQNVALKERSVADLEREILGVRGQMRSYFKRYCEHTRRKARDLHFDSIITERTKKTFLDVSIQKVTKDYVSIVHSGGATRLSPSELSPALRERLAYGDPLGLRELDQEMKELKMDREREEKRMPKTYGPQERQAIAEKLMNIPQSADKVAPATAESIEPPSKMPKVETK